MYTLEEHIDTEYRDRRAHRQVVTRLVQRTVRLFGNHRAFYSGKGWQYELKPGPPHEPHPYSHSTNAMITWALNVLESRTSYETLAPVPLAPHVINEFWTETTGRPEDNGRLTDCRNEIQKHMRQGLALLMKKVGEQPKECLTISRTFGDNDPLTLGWLLDLGEAMKALESNSEGSDEPGESPSGSEEPTRNRGDAGSLRERLHRVAADQLRQVEGLLGGRNETPGGVSGDAPGEGNGPDVESKAPDNEQRNCRALDRAWDGERFRNAFWVLRYGHLADMLRRHPDDDGEVNPVPNIGRLAQPFFEGRFHEHMAATGTTSFDPAEFVFAFEGLVRWAPQSPRSGTIERVFATLREAQATSAYWRPTRPVVANQQGMVLFPLSVEVANSLLRVIYSLDREDPRRQVFHRNLGLFIDYVEWLESQLAKVGPSGDENGDTGCFGWHSEYDPSRVAIHTWQTSQVLAFLAQFAALLQINIERRLREAGRFHESPSRWDPQPAEKHKTWQTKTTRWDEWFVKNEPIRPMDSKPMLSRDYAVRADRDPWENGVSHYEVLRRIRRDFVVPTARADLRKPEKFSFALYGPPGTGKTTQAEELAKALGLPLLKLTTSDFVMGGEGEVEARAKSIFEALEEQSKAVIFFDELDRLLLDRTSRGYSRQSDLFQFMTPGMLTKLQDLRDRKRCIFVLATNHHERIDSAVKRAGRIDEHYLLLPPNCAQRVVLLRRFLDERAEANGIKFDEGELQEAVAEAGAHTPLFVWNELRQLIRDAWDRGGTASDITEQLVELAKSPDRRPGITFARYESSFKALAGEDFEWNQEPWEEVLLLIHLLAERPGDEEPQLPSNEDPKFKGEMAWLSRFAAKTEKSVWKERLEYVQEEEVRNVATQVLRL